MNKFLYNIENLIKFKPVDYTNFDLSCQDNSVDNREENSSSSTKKIYAKLSKNLNYLRYMYNADICSDVITRNFHLLSNNIQYDAFIIYLDGMVDANLINDFILKPLMNRNNSNTFDETQKKMISYEEINNTRIKRYSKEKQTNLAESIYNNLVPQNAVTKIFEFTDVFLAINSGNCILFVESLDTAFNLDVKGFKQRTIDTPKNEILVRGSQESFVENIRTNTSILRRLVNTENLVLEDSKIGKLTNTNIAIGYVKGITNKNLISEVKKRLSNLNVDFVTSSGQVEQLIQDFPESLFPQIIATERPDKVVNYLLEGRICIIVNGSPYVLVVPGVLVDFLSSPEDLNLKFQFSNLQKIIRLFSAVLAILLPGLYIAITNYHQELLPTEILFTIASSRESVPFPIFIEILLMEASFELIREAGLRVPSPLGQTIGIVGALILGEAAVSASLVSPILIIIVAITGLCSFSIPDFSLNFTCRIYRFLYIILGYLAGFLGIGSGIFVQLTTMCGLSSFGAPYLTFFTSRQRSISNYFVPPGWKREERSVFLHAQKKNSQGKFSMLWRKK